MIISQFIQLPSRGPCETIESIVVESIADSIKKKENGKLKKSKITKYS